MVSLHHLNELTATSRLSPNEFEKSQALNDLSDYFKRVSVNDLLLNLESYHCSYFSCSWISNHIFKKLEEGSVFDADRTFLQLFSFICSRSDCIVSTDLDILAKTLQILVTRLSPSVLTMLYPDLKHCLVHSGHLHSFGKFILFHLIDSFSSSGTPLHTNMIPFVHLYIELMKNMFNDVTSLQISSVYTILSVLERFFKKFSLSEFEFRTINSSLIIPTLFQVITNVSDNDCLSSSLTILKTIVPLFNPSSCHEKDDFASLVLTPTIDLMCAVCWDTLITAGSVFSAFVEFLKSISSSCFFSTVIVSESVFVKYNESLKNFSKHGCLLTNTKLLKQLSSLVSFPNIPNDGQTLPNKNKDVKSGSKVSKPRTKKPKTPTTEEEEFNEYSPPKRPRRSSSSAVSTPPLKQSSTHQSPYNTRSRANAERSNLSTSDLPTVVVTTPNSLQELPRDPSHLANLRRYGCSHQNNRVSDANVGDNSCRNMDNCTEIKLKNLGILEQLKVEETNNTVVIALKDERSNKSIFVNVFKKIDFPSSPYDVTTVEIKCSVGMEFVNGLADFFPNVQSLFFRKQLRTPTAQDVSTFYVFPRFTCLTQLVLDTSLDIDVSHLTALTSLSLKSTRTNFLTGLENLPSLKNLCLHFVALSNDGLHPNAPIRFSDIKVTEVTDRTKSIIRRTVRNFV
ncbi:hypothetical protein RCL1_005398 [Eukaryota sp. TZLM3-RCL]